MFAKILIANRGEIACRVMRTARALGMRTVAVFPEADRRALHVRHADTARLIDSYLDIDTILAAARASGAEAIHPGYGFLAENERFAAACRKAGMAFIGPSAEAIAAMGDKSAAKRLMEKAGVPLVPGYHGESQETQVLEKEAARLGYPLLIKPCAGGGGKGMRVVSGKSSFLAALEASKREARSSFGDERVLLESYLERPRHIEVQVFGDAHGNVVHLYERDCSLQRRHQKVMEEAPAPRFEKRNEICSAALAAARAIAYSNAGTVEFIAGQDGRFYFMEMNTRLQVEHPVTEMITGVDLVEWQLRVAAGERLPLTQEQISFEGHAIEARIYAEDADRGFLPSSGRVVYLGLPQENSRLRIDTGIETGADIPPWYDPMIAKLIVRGEDRAQALARLQQALAEVQIAGPITNVEFLRRVASSPAFIAGELDTGFVERHRGELSLKNDITDEVLAAAALAELAEEELAARRRAHASGDPYSPWHKVDGWRLNQESHHDFHFLDGEAEHRVRVRFLARGQRIDIGGRDLALEGERLADGSALVRLDGRLFRSRIVREGRDWHVFCDAGYRRLTLKEELHGLDIDAGGGSLAAPMPGRIVNVMVEAGARVSKGQPLLTLEAMKMEHTITAPADGVVTEIHFAAGEQVAEGVELIRMET